MNYFRHQDKSLTDHFRKYREILVLLGARQTGKTTILKKLFPQALYLSCDNESIKQNLEKYDVSVYKQLLPKEREVVIDEIHLLSDPGRCAKIIYDQISGIKLIITGSSSLSIKNRATESLAGRKIDYYLYPLTFSEYLVQKDIEKMGNFKIMENILSGKTLFPRAHLFDLSGILENILLYGAYPAVLNHPADTEYLKNLAEALVFKDLLELKMIENKKAALNLLRLLAYQIGSLVNISELSSRLGISTITVRRYLSIFEESFVIFSLYPYASKARDEIGKMPKIYFYDTGLRNAVIGNFNHLSGRADFGALFENFIISEIYKYNIYGNYGFKLNFWRTKQGSEMDLVLEKEDALIGVEIKKSGKRLNTAFKRRYPQAKTAVLTRENFY